ncbi:hypothetical protein BZA05DRAFT_435199 [Tricharina praecox]|uniref:uncharacterized protein n=1 Tax=Tricharina praecox TaxID=43433 RepID=UPI00221FEF20|nr:uncharacterized protein BZA05DRAFT_435199 [Tricharina praecox]KAI5854163.1 hypothetical protein BZA05DRAFT_435199 [Tricharina praecox]
MCGTFIFPTLYWAAIGWAGALEKQNPSENGRDGWDGWDGWDARIIYGGVRVRLEWEREMRYGTGGGGGGREEVMADHSWRLSGSWAEMAEWAERTPDAPAVRAVTPYLQVRKSAWVNTEVDGTGNVRSPPRSLGRRATPTPPPDLVGSTPETRQKHARNLQRSAAPPYSDFARRRIYVDRAFAVLGGPFVFVLRFRERGREWRLARSPDNAIESAFSRSIHSFGKYHTSKRKYEDQDQDKDKDKDKDQDQDKDQDNDKDQDQSQSAEHSVRKRNLADHRFALAVGPDSGQSPSRAQSTLARSSGPLRTAKGRYHETTRPRDHETTRPRDHEIILPNPSYPTSSSSSSPTAQKSPPHIPEEQQPNPSTLPVSYKHQIEAEHAQPELEY